MVTEAFQSLCQLLFTLLKMEVGVIEVQSQEMTLARELPMSCFAYQASALNQNSWILEHCVGVKWIDWQYFLKWYCLNKQQFHFVSEKEKVKSLPPCWYFFSEGCRMRIWMIQGLGFRKPASHLGKAVTEAWQNEQRAQAQQPLLVPEPLARSLQQLHPPRAVREVQVWAFPNGYSTLSGLQQHHYISSH